MKETGVVRRIDELGRLVIPKEIRKHMRIREGDSVEIYISPEGLIVLKKHSIFQGIEDDLVNLVKTLFESIGNTVITTDVNKVISISGKNSEKYKDLELSKRFLDVLEMRRQVHTSNLELSANVFIEEHLFLIPIIVNGDLFGSVIVIEDSRTLLPNDLQIIQTMTKFIIKQLEV